MSSQHGSYYPNVGSSMGIPQDPTVPGTQRQLDFALSELHLLSSWGSEVQRR